MEQKLKELQKEFKKQNDMMIPENQPLISELIRKIHKLKIQLNKK